MKNNDIKIDTEFENFKLRVNGLLVVDDQLLSVKIDDNSFYCLPGGHMKIGEDSQEAIIREFKEETGLNVKIDKLYSITENFFQRKNGKKIHELGFYYLLSPTENLIKEDKDIIENEEGKETKLSFKWFNINNIENVDFRPYQIKGKLKDGNTGFEHILIK